MGPTSLRSHGVTAPIYGWHANLVMLRYDAAIFVDGAEAPDR